MHSRKLTYILLAMLAIAQIVSGQTHLGDLRQNPDELYDYACGLYRRNMYERALPELELVVKTSPDSQKVEKAAYFKIVCLNKLNRKEEMTAEAIAFRDKYKKGELADSAGILASEVLMEKGKYSEAKEILFTMQESSSQVNAEYASYEMALCLEKTGGMEEAYAIYKRLSSLPFEKKFECRIHAARKYADYLMRRNQLNEALLLITKMRESQFLPQEYKDDVLFFSGEICYKQNKQKQAAEYFEDYIVQYPKGRYIRWCRSYRLRLAFNAGLYDELLQQIQDIRELHPEEAFGDIDFMHAKTLRMLKKYQEALPFYQRVLADERSTEEQKMESAYESIECLLAARLYAEAISQAMAFVENYPKSTRKGEVLYYCSQAMLYNGQTAEAEEQCRKAMVLLNDQPEQLARTVGLLTDILQRREKWAEAVTVLLAQADTPQAAGKLRISLLQRAARTAYQGKKRAQAIEIYRKIAQEYTEKEVRFTAYSSIFQIHLAEKNYKEALADIAEMKQNCPAEKYPLLLLNNAYVLHYSGNSSEAIEILRQIVNSSEKNAEIDGQAQFMLASILLTEERESEAIPVLDTIMAKYPALPQISAQFLIKSGDVYLHNGKHAEARKCWAQMEKLQNATLKEKQNALIHIARDMVETRQNLTDAEKILEELRLEMRKTEQQDADSAEVLSLLSEISMLQGKAELARVNAERTLKMSNYQPRTAARARYILARFYLDVEKNAENANRFATQCYILADDSLYGPEAMAISIKAFKMQKNYNQANEVLKELSAKYPKWLAEHQEIKR